MTPEPLVVPFGYVLKPQYRPKVGHWKMNVNGGNVLPDLSGNNNHGILTNFNWTATSGWGGNGLIFDGLNDYVSLGNKSILTNIPSAITLSLWIYPLNITGLQYLGGKGSDKICLYFDYTNILKFRTSGLSPGVVLTSATAFNNKQWYHIAVTYDANAGSNNKKIYVNGIIDSQATITGNLDTSVETYILGAYYSLGLYYFNGVMDDFRVTNGALSADEVAHAYFQQEDEWDFGIDEMLGGGTPIELLQGQGW